MNVVIAIKSDLSEQELPWYRYGWPWFLISIPMVSIVLSSAMLYLAVNANNSLVVDDYYKEGKAYNLRIERDRLASVLGVRAAVSQTQEGLILQLDWQTPVDLPISLVSQAQTAAASYIVPSALRVRWVHVTQAQRDGAAQMQHIGGSRYLAQGVVLPPQGKFRLHIEPASSLSGSDQSAAEVASDWRLVSKLSGFDTADSITIEPPVPAKVFTASMLD